MAQFCAFYGCENKLEPNSNIKFFRFPSKVKVDDESVELQQLLKRRRTAWYHAIQRTDITENDLNSRRICSQHFISGN